VNEVAAEEGWLLLTLLRPTQFLSTVLSAIREHAVAAGGTFPTFIEYKSLILFHGACGIVVGCGTVLKAGKSRVRFSMRPLVSSILPAEL
jgi:hypothetical protein